MLSSLEKLAKSNYDNVIIGSEPEKYISEPVNPEIEESPEALEIPSEHHTSEKSISEQQIMLPTSEPPSEQHTELIPNQYSVQTLENTVVLSDSEFDSAT
ncbi:hypothetical protein A2U01_0067435, partial [Trifolium medium]|nr:hypothetical protein [Trifolium medium]